MSLTSCPQCAAPVPSDGARCPHCHGRLLRGSLHAAAIGAALLGLVACDADTDVQPVYGVSETETETETDTEEDTETSDTEG